MLDADVLWAKDHPDMVLTIVDAANALESMAKGELNNTVFQDPVGQGEESVNAAYLLVKKEPNPKVVDGNILIPYQPINKENYKSYMK